MLPSLTAAQLGHLAAIVEHSDDAIISKTLQGIVTSWNKGAERLYGYTAAEMIGQPIVRLIPPGMPDEEPSILARLQRGEVIDHYDTVRVARDGRILNVSVTISPIKDADGTIIGASKIARNVTQKKEADAALARALEEARVARAAAEQASLAKSEFLANVSHELRTPLNAIHGVAMLLGKTEELGERDRRLVQTLHTSTETLLSLINDLLDISKIESHVLDLEAIPFRFSEIVPQVVSMVRDAARAKGLDLRLDYGGLEHRTFLGDPVRLRQVLLNLCGNAVKFTEAGHISIRLHGEPPAEGKERVLLRVSDTGIGIPKEKQAAIFEKFVQGDSSINRKYGGTGLGLAISRLLSEAMGGVLTVESSPGRGSTFSLSIPLKSSDSPPPRDSAPVQDALVGRGNILIVEDYAPSAFVTSAFLEMEGYTVEVAENGLDTVKRVGESSYLAVLMDVQMPGLNGFQATQRIRESEHRFGRPASHIIGMTAHAGPEHREKCFTSGMNDFISKPFDPTELKRKLASLKKP